MPRGEPPPAPERLPAPVVDAHTHLDAAGATDRASVAAMLDRAEAAGVDRVVTVADDLDSARWAAQASTWDSRVFAAVALHPTRTARFTDADRDVLRALAIQPRVVAIGETGLDYYWDHSPPERQQEAFRWHIELAKSVGKPLMIHDRDAHEDILTILKDEGSPDTVIFHCFSGDADFARRCVSAGFVLSFSGTVTFRNARGVRDAAALVPSDQLLVETDAPFLTPHPFRGRPNEPYCAAYTVRELAALRNTDIGQMADILANNANRLFGLGRTA
ncbi:MAG TPA: TatD family hydrolase [Pseudonocardiaceae bacterium]|nr:TatD family hydrolase [Pseudonocardiaceae bacterium]